jgi:hypothetical protein
VTVAHCLILDRAGDFPQSLPLAANRGPVYLIRTGESVETPMVSQNGGFHLLARLPHHRRQGLCRGPHYGLPRRVQRTLSRINIKMAVELSAEKSA